jgi:hypothetical protein
LYGTIPVRLWAAWHESDVSVERITSETFDMLQDLGVLPESKRDDLLRLVMGQAEEFLRWDQHDSGELDRAREFVESLHHLRPIQKCVSDATACLERQLERLTHLEHKNYDLWESLDRLVAPGLRAAQSALRQIEFPTVEGWEFEDPDVTDSSVKKDAAVALYDFFRTSCRLDRVWDVEVRVAKILRLLFDVRYPYFEEDEYEPDGTKHKPKGCPNVQQLVSRRKEQKRR